MNYQNNYEQLIRWGQQILNDNDAGAAENWLRRFNEYAVDLKNGNKNSSIVNLLLSLRTNIYNLSKFGISKRDRFANMMNGKINEIGNTENGNNETNESKNMKKNIVKLNESQLRQIVVESVKRVLKEEGEGIEAMGSVPSEGYGKYGKLMEKLDEAGDKEIEYILQKYGVLNGRDFSNKSFTGEMVYSFLQQLKSSMIHQLDTRYW